MRISTPMQYIPSGPTNGEVAAVEPQERTLAPLVLPTAMKLWRNRNSKYAILHVRLAREFYMFVVDFSPSCTTTKPSPPRMLRTNKTSLREAGSSYIRSNLMRTSVTAVIFVADLKLTTSFFFYRRFARLL